MGTVWIKEFTGGLDARRLPETTPGGVAIRATDCHVTTGGEFEKRAAFVPEFTLPFGTKGLAHDRMGLIVFGSGTEPVGMPAGVRYQRLEHPDGANLVGVPSHDLYDGKVYAAAEFDDGSVYHFYDGTVVDDWFDGRARAAFTVTGGTGADEMTDLEVGGVSIFTAPVSWATSNADTAAAIAAEINGTTSTPDYSATAVGAVVNVIAADQGTAANGLAVTATLTGAFAIDPASDLVMADGGVAGGAQATASFRVSGSTPTGTIDVAVDGVDLTAAPVTFGASDTIAAAAIAAAINSHASTPDYTAAALLDTVVITTVDNTDDVNGLSPTFTFTGLAATGGSAASGSFKIAGVSLGYGGTPTTSSIRPRVNGVNITSAAVVAASSSATALATAIASAINSHTSTPDYSATSSGATVTVTAATNNDETNAFTFSFVIEGIVTVSDVTGFSGGADALPAGTAVADVVAFSGGALDDAFVPGTFVRTVKSKIYATAGSILHFSGIQAPTEWTTDAPGAGFINMAAQNSGSERLTAVSRYQNLLAVFSPEVVQIWFVDPDPNLNTQSQVLMNTGTDYPRSVAQFGDSDVFYLDVSGVRSLRARDSSNAAATSDIGVPIDDLLKAKMRTLTDAEKGAVVGLINPIDKRFWLVVKDEIYVFSFFQNAKVSAWTTYSTTAKTEDGDLAFVVDCVAVYNRRPYLRAGDVIFVYGGSETDLVYDQTEAEVWLPYLDANRPTAHKQWEAVDVALTGVWEIQAGMDPTNLDAVETLATVSQTTYNLQRIAFNHACSHVSLRFRCTGDGLAVLSAAVLHFAGDEKET
jgi:hypothetical protein